jgi:CubicO group peptidase (beta-lactamase class C family)
MRTSIVHRLKSGDSIPFASVLTLASAILWLSCLSCGPLSSRIIYDPKASVSRMESGHTSIEAEVDELAKPIIESKEATCLEVGVLLSDGSIQSYGYGRVSDTGPPVLPDKDTIFQIGSVSKLFTASMLEFLVQNGEIKFSETVRDILPKNASLSAAMGKITVYELATHTSGLPREPITLKQLMYFIDYEFTGKNLYGYMDKKWLFHYMKTAKLKYRSHEFHYSNIGYGLLAHLIEAKTDRPFRDLVKEKIFSPLNMKDTVFSLSREQQGRQAMGHVGDQPYFMKRNTPLKAWDMGEVMSAAGGIYSTVTDLLIYAKHTLDVENLPINNILIKTTEPQVKQQDGETSALGWTISDSGDEHTMITYKQGMASGYCAYIGMNMSKKIAVVVLCSSFNWKDKIGHNLLLRLSQSSDRLSQP